MNDVSLQLRVTSIRSRGKSGGAIFAGVADDGNSYVVVCDYRLIPDASLVTKGQVWSVEGSVAPRPRNTPDGSVVIENQIAAKQAELRQPAGENIVEWIVSSSDCAGIGRVKAQRLKQRFGPALLVDHIEQRRLTELTRVVSEESAQRLCDAFAKFKVANVLQWLDQIGIPRKIGMRVVTHYGERAQEEIEADPYVLISFEASWRRVDEMARTRFRVAEDDPRRLTSAIEEVLYAGNAQGHTCLPERDVQVRAQRLLVQPELVASALRIAESPSGGPPRYRKFDGYYQAEGSYLIESYVAARLHAMAAGEDHGGQAGLFSQISDDPKSVALSILESEAAHGDRPTDGQRNAILTSVSHHLSLILGGAGTGKTTALKLLYKVFDALQPGVAIYQLALAGRAAQRMAEATGREAMTIAAFLTRVDPAQIDFGSIVVVDEMSMVDVNLMYRLLRHLPSGVHMILVGDPSQLTPIGPGLVLHALVGLSTIPQTELTEVKRQSAASGIPRVASAIRAHESPVWADYHGKPGVGVSFVPCAPLQLEAKVCELYEQLGGHGRDFSVQILSITNANFGGVENLNVALHNRYQGNAEHVYCFDPEFGVVGASTVRRVPLCVGDLIMFTENDYTLGLRNGSLGRIVEALTVVQDDDPCCVCEFEGAEYLLNSDHMGALNHAYAITVHKAQGSQFKSVILPIRTSRLLDQALLYTAVTRGIGQVVLVGDEAAALNAINAHASAARRHITLPKLLAEGTSERSPKVLFVSDTMQIDNKNVV